MKLLFVFLAISLVTMAVAAPVDLTDSEIMETLKEKGIRLETARAVFYFDDVTLNREKASSFIADVTKGIQAIETFTGKKFDAQHYGTSRIEYYISQHTTVSHVYNGYRHNEGNALPAIFFSSKRFNKEALPYLHETTHLILREFHSLWLREGMAEWVAMQVAKKLGKGHVAFYGDDGKADAHHLAAGIVRHEAKDTILNTVGMNGTPSFKNAEVRRMFYIGSTSFVGYLSALLTKERLLELYAAQNTKKALEEMLGNTIDRVKEDWLKGVTDANEKK